MAQKKPAKGFVLYYDCPFRGLDGKEAVRRMLPRSGVVELEMAQAMKGDLTKLRIKWEIRNNVSGELIEQSNYSEEVGQ